MTNQLPKLNAALIKVVGVFNYTNAEKKALKMMGYQPLPICLGHEKDSVLTEKDIDFIRDNYYQEFSELFFNIEQSHSLSQYLDNKFNIKFIKESKNNTEEIDCSLIKPELYFFSNDDTGIFTLTFEISKSSLELVSNITYCASSFDGKIKYENCVYKFHEWISKFVLSNISLRGKQVQSDKFSGSKFKIYTIIDIDNFNKNEIYPPDYLLYEIGTRSKLLTCASKGYFAPSKEYFDELMNAKISIFNNYQGLALLDSFTIIGSNIYPPQVNSDDELKQQNLYKRVYFSMYVFNLYVRYSVFKFNATFKDDEVKKRDEFEDFINQYNLKHVSFNFLPNIFFNKIRESLQIELEIEHFENRLQKLADKIKEEQEKRQAILLGIISALSSISAIEPILDYLGKISIWLGLDVWELYIITFFTLLLLAVPLLFYLYPKLLDKSLKRIKGR